MLTFEAKMTLIVHVFITWLKVLFVGTIIYWYKCWMKKQHQWILFCVKRNLNDVIRIIYLFSSRLRVKPLFWQVKNQEKPLLRLLMSTKPTLLSVVQEDWARFAVHFWVVLATTLYNMLDALLLLSGKIDDQLINLVKFKPQL